jgi:hypothetical protein
MTISMNFFYCIVLFLAFGITLLCGFIWMCRHGSQSIEATLAILSALNAAFAFTLICVSVLLGALSLYWFLHGLEASYFFAGLCLSTVVCFVLHHKNTGKTGFLLCLVANVLFVLFSIFFMSSFYDSSFDGRTYHQTAVYYLKNGWIPGNEQIFIRWCNEYPKAPWIWGALVYALGGSIEGGKSINCLAVYALFNLALHFSLRLNRTVTTSFIFATLAIVNPVVITQFFTFYTDGLLYTFFMSMVLLVSLLLLQSAKDRWFIIALLLLMIPFTANIKFTGIIYAYLTLGLACVFAVVRKQKAPLLAIVRISILSIVLSVIIVGYNPYWSNVLSGKHLFHPLSGSSNIDIMTMNRPRYMNVSNPLYNFISSLLSKVSNDRDLSTPELRNPLQLKVFQEIKSINLETRTNGFGPHIILWFIASLVLLGYAACKKWPSRPGKTQLVFILLAIIMSTISNREAWWARYVPHVWFIIPLVLVSPPFSRLFSIVRMMVIVACLATSIPVIYYTIDRNQATTLSLKQGIEAIKSAKNNIVVFSQMKHFDTALKALLEDNDLPFIYASPADKLKPLYVYKERQKKRVVVCQKID